MQSMADRYMYLPMIGLAIAVAWGAPRWLAPAAPIVLAACAVLTWRQIPVWRDGLTLFTNAIAVTRDNFVAHDNRGVELDRRGRYDEAIAEYRETLRIKPGDRNGESNLAQASFAKGERLFLAGNPEGALPAFEEGLRYRPRHALARTYVGLIFLQRQQLAAAMQQFRIAVDADPALPRAHLGLGVAFATAGRDADARREFETAVHLDPTSVEAHFDLALALAATGDRAGAVREIDRVLRLQPNHPDASKVRAALGAQ